jgi:ATP-dependent DNA helicase RecG
VNISDLINQGESKTLELKESLPKNDSIAKTAIAFSNTSGGKLVIGVNDKREIVGIDDSDIFGLQDKIASIIFDSCAPNILPEIYTLNIDGKLLLVIEIFRGNLLPYYLKSEGKNNGTYIRVGATNRKASIENIVELERQRNHIGYDEELNYEVAFDSLDLTPLYKRFEQQNKAMDISKLKNLRLIKEEYSKIYPSNALLIVLGYYEHCRVITPPPNNLNFSRIKVLSYRCLS